MRKHPLLAFATTSLSLSFGALSHGATSAHHQDTSTRGVATTQSAAGRVPDTAQDTIVNLLSYRSPALRADPDRRPRTSAQRAQLARLRHRRLHHAERMVQLLRRAAAAVPQKPNPQKPTEATGVWAALRGCESGGDYAIDTGNGYYGAYQFSLSSWRLLGYGGLPNQAAPTVQDAAAKALAAIEGWGAWPHCSWALGLA